ncbi:phosphotransferase family protein [Mycoplasma procyoni]|uniref:phosphotransferase family protein n=1 Tax=Mycoplasma procyoni TaxID=568784 RepID=UPI00197BCF6D|nr:phosphotransferase [Mycoplasma procyoni]MBN3534626.1 phosphotransferase [Mycoplasma procyoni]
MKTRIKDGYTNISFKEDNTFLQQKQKDIIGVNHRMDYQILSVFDFVPELKENTETTLRYQWIDGQEFEVSDQSLKEIAQLMKKLHKTKIKFPGSNHAERIKKYIKILNDKNIKIDIINEYYKKIHLILRNMKKDTPLHNDLWTKNIIRDKNNKIWIVDWEYASMGDKHFDLAYFIESCRLNDEQETILLNEYDDYDYEYILQHRILVLYLIILWLNVQETKPFDDSEFIIKIRKISEILEQRQKEWREKKSV